MDANHQDKANNNLAVTQDAEWVLSKKSKLLIPQRKNQIKVNRGWTGFSGRTLWDWIQFFAVLAIPIIVAVGTLYFTQQQAQLSIIASEKLHQTDLQVAQDQSREQILENYISSISNILLHDNLRKSKVGDEVRTVARTETLTALHQLDGVRKGTLIQFLYQSQLINAPQSSSDHSNPIISLGNADLTGISLIGNQIALPVSQLSSSVKTKILKLFPTGTTIKIDRIDAICEAGNPPTYNLLYNNTDDSLHLDGIDLSGTDLNNAILECISLTKANLNASDMNNVNLSTDNLQGAIMPNVLIHP